MRVAVALSLGVAALLVAGCGGRKSAAVATTTAVVRAGGGSSQGIDVISTSRAGIAGVPAAALPGITVVGTGEQSASPDHAVVQLVIGSGDFGPSGPALQLIEPAELDPIVKALRGAGASDIEPDRFGQGPFGNEAAATITLTVDHADGVDAAIEAAQAAVRAHTSYGLQASNVVFGLKNCPDVEQQAWHAALADAKQRAQRLADQTGVQLGDLLAVSEVTAAPTPYSSASTGCQSLERPPAYGTLLSGAENTEERVTIEAALQVTYAIK